MNGKTTRRSTPVILTALLGGLVMVLAPPAQAKDRYYLLEESYPSTMEYRCVDTLPVTTVEKTVTIEKPVYIQRSTRTIKTMRTTAFKAKRTHHLATRPIRHRTHVIASRPRTFAQRTVVQRTIATEPMLIEKPLWVEQTVEKPVQVERPMIIDKAVEFDQPVLLKKHHHLVEFNLF